MTTPPQPDKPDKPDDQTTADPADAPSVTKKGATFLGYIDKNADPEDMWQTLKTAILANKAKAKPKSAE